MAKAKTATKGESPAEVKLKALYTLQSIDSKIDKIRQVIFAGKDGSNFVTDRLGLFDLSTVGPIGETFITTDSDTRRFSSSSGGIALTQWTNEFDDIAPGIEEESWNLNNELASDYKDKPIRIYNFSHRQSVWII